MKICWMMSVVIVLLLCNSVHAQLQVSSAWYGIVNSGGSVAAPRCDAKPNVAAVCDGKEFCQIYIDPRYLCPDPAYDRQKSLDVNYTCNGKQQQVLSFPDTAQLVLRCTRQSRPSTNAVSKQLQITSARYGLVGAGGRVTSQSCDAKHNMSAACDGKTFCQVYVDPRYLCPDPAYGRQKSLDVDYTCNGRSASLSFPDTAQAVIRCE